jgi:hypothetical protein
MKKFLVILSLIASATILTTAFSITNADPRDYDEICDRLHYWEDYGGTGEPYAMCSGMPYDCLCPITVTPGSN